MHLFIFNTAPYDGERVYNGIRLATQMAKSDEVQLKVFLMADSVYSAIAGQEPPHYNFKIDQMVEQLTRAGAEIGACGVCMDARRVVDDTLVTGVRRSTMAELADWTIAAEKVIVF